MGKLGLGPVGLALNVSASYLAEADVHSADAVAELYARLDATAPGRFVPGLGGSQQPRSLAALHAYLDRLDQAHHVILHVLAEGGQPGPIETARAVAGR